MKRIIVIASAMMLTFVGCTLAPRYTRPDLPVPDEWPQGPAYMEKQARAETTSVVSAPWQQFFVDEKLQKVIELALANSRDLRVALLNVDKVRALYGIQRSELFPTIDAIGGGHRQRTSGYLTEANKPRITEQYNVDFGLSAWEVDLFGRLRSLKDQALENYLATEQAGRGAQIVLVSAVANAYLSLAADQETLKLVHATLESQQSGYDLIRRRYEVGLVPELVLYQAETRVEAARVDVALYTRLVAQDINALNLLVGIQVASDLLPTDLNSINLAENLFAGAVSELLLYRPDILQAENLLKAANASIGAARAAFFPRIVLTTIIGTASDELSGLFESGTNTWAFAPRFVLPIFDSRLWYAARAVEVEQEIALAQYEKAIQNAFREVADALVVLGTVNQQQEAQQALVDAADETYRLAQVRFSKGIDSFLTVLDAQRSLYSAQQALIAVRLLRLANKVQLYAVLGGGSR